MAGLVSTEQLPAAAAAAEGMQWPCGNQMQQMLQLPLLPPSAAAAAAASNNSKGRSVVFKFGQLRHKVSASMYKQICSSSKMISSILSREGKRPSRPITVFATPHFTPEANCWVLQCLEHWLISQQLAGFNAEQAAKLWVAADFWQVDGLQVACEDVITAAAASDAAQLAMALELCLRHRAGSLRLQRLSAQVVMRGMAESVMASGCSCACVGQLQGLLEQYRVVLLPGIHSELRDRLVVACMLNAGLDADNAEDMVG